ncbi:Rhodanese-related sulfurtransferase [Marinobacterium lacunae]|uniref:Rhodanese-related sulfurtransferase n=2 Tax=Marinobacterium lacunae TaxID=1232683 RepID=A0A081FW63_9GAMM|nr:Rhodanese-related sulfurtransferase [Marinobacterium lacunae]
MTIGYAVHPWGYYLTAFVGLNLLQSAFTNWCPAMSLFRALGLKEQRCSKGMSVHQGVHLIAGVLVLATLGAVFIASAPQQILVITALIGLSLVQSSFTGWCPAIFMSKMLGFHRPDVKG